MAGSAQSGRALPTGTITFLFTDVEGSTRLIRSHPELYPHLLERHHSILREAFGECGVEFGSEGDALFYAFARADDALTAAVRGQRGLSGEEWPPDAALRVRMGLNTGSAEQVGDNYVGLELHRVARIMAAAHGGQVLMSGTTAALCEGRTGDARLADLGGFNLKDFDEPERLWQVSALGLPADFPPPRTRQGRTVALPREPSPLLGRASDLAHLQELARTHRLLTLTGPGGSGKTRLALALAWALAPRFTDDVAFVELAPVAVAEMAPQAIASSIGGRAGGLSSVPELCEHLADAQALLILDNAEHLEGFGSQVDALLNGCAQLRVVATSRIPLGVAGEQTYPVAPLEEEAAVALITERVTAQRPTFEASEADLDDLREVAERLACLPLALELAAARLRVLSPRSLRERLDRQLDLLRDVGSGLPSRQRTMRAAIDWSFQLLAVEDVHVFNSLATFVAPASLSSIAYVAELDELDALDALGRLADASLITVSDAMEPRYGMLEPIRQFAAERLTDDVTAAGRTVDRLIGWYESQVLDRPMFLAEAASIVSDVDNYREALQQAIDRREYARWIGLVYPITRLFSSTRSLHDRLAGWFEQVDPEILAPGDRVRLAFIRATTTGWLDRTLWDDVLSLARSLGDSENERFALLSITNSYLGDNRLDDAAATLAEADAIDTSTPILEAFSPVLTAQLAEFREDPHADDCWERATVAARSTGDPSNAIPTIDTWAYALFGRGEFDRARGLVDDVFELTVGVVGDTTLVYMSACQRAMVYLACGDVSVALESIVDALALDGELNAMNRTVPVSMLLFISAAVLGAGGRLEAALTVSEVARRRLYVLCDISDERVIAQLQPFIDSASARLSADRRAASIAAADPLDEGDAIRLAIDEVGIALRDARAAAEVERT